MTSALIEMDMDKVPTLTTGELKRLNAGKTRQTLLPQPLTDAEANLYTAGARKYAAWGWLEHPMDEEETLDSALRHIAKWRAGEIFDTETGAHHLTAARWNLGVLFMYEYEGITEPGRRVFLEDRDFATARTDAEVKSATYLRAREIEKMAEAQEGTIPNSSL